MPGSFHEVVESKVAPMLATGPYVGWIIDINGIKLEASRRDEWHMDTYLTPEEGLQAVYRYADVYNEPITNETVVQINCLCMSDPFFNSCVFRSNHSEKDLASKKGVIDTVDYEINNRHSRMSKIWRENFSFALQKVNDRYAKRLLLHLIKHSDRYWSNIELKESLFRSFFVMFLARVFRFGLKWCFFTQIGLKPLYKRDQGARNHLACDGFRSVSPHDFEGGVS